MKRALYALMLLTLSTVPLNADKVVSDSTLGYSIYLPTDSWVRVIKNQTHHQFYDTAYIYESQISIVRHSYTSTDFPTPESWTRANFIAYKLCADYSFDPWGAILYYDTASTVRQGISWAIESYTTFFTLDTSLGAWAEYTRYTARNGYGWELYAIGDTADMMNNIGTYAGMIRLITLPGDTNAKVIHRSWTPATAGYLNGTKPGYSRVVFDPLGRVRSLAPNRAASPSGVFIRPDIHRVSPIVK
jgi:hypothetical protein